MDYSSLLFLVVFVIIAAYFIYESYRKRPRKTAYVVRELLVCMSCNYRVERDFEPGDFIGLIKGKCPSCGGDLKLRGIYSIERSKI
ncbi:MAG: hypothetical protein QXK88_02295 [Desulfurococcaceae archaeon]